MKDIASLECPVELVNGELPLRIPLNEASAVGTSDRGVREPRASFGMILKKLADA
jgi:hypothetical protein